MKFIFIFALLTFLAGVQADIGVVTCRPSNQCSEISAPNEGCRVNAGLFCDVTATMNGVDNCRRVMNGTGSDILVPAGSGTQDWATFIMTDLNPWGINKDGGCSTGTVHCDSVTTINWNVAGKTCSGSVAGPRNWNSVESSTDSGQPTTGSASYTCNNGSWVQNAGATCVEQCAGATVSWGSGCSASVATTNDQGTQGVSDPNSGGGDPWTGNANFRCDNGSWTFVNGNCDGTPCGAQGMTWNGSCGGNIGALGSGQSTTVSNTFAGYTGSANYTCTNGSWSAPSGQSCSANGCGGASFNWGSCSGSVGATGSGGSATANNTVAGYSGSAVFSCNLGNWSGPSSQSCSANGCGGATFNWGSCSGSVGATGSGGSATANNSNGGFNGSAVYTCNNGSWSGPSSQSCTPAASGCATETKTWGAGCSGSLAAASSGNSSTATNSNSGYSGSVTYTCSNGTWGSASGASCTASCGADDWQIDGPTSCFVKGTLITLASGAQVAIESVKVGDLVRTYNESTGQFTVSPVAKAIHHQSKFQKLYKFSLSSGRSITATDIHPLYIKNLAQYIQASEVHERWLRHEKLVMMNGVGQSVKILNIHFSEKVVPVYNLHVKGVYDTELAEQETGHNYIAEGILVHNKTQYCPANSQQINCCTSSGGTVTPCGDDYAVCSGTTCVHALFNSCMSGGGCNQAAIDTCNKSKCVNGGACSPDYDSGVVDNCGCPGGKSQRMWCQGGVVKFFTATYCM